MGAFLVYTGLKMLHPVRWNGGRGPGTQSGGPAGARLVPLAPAYDGSAFSRFTRDDGLLTPLALVLVVVETTDVVFALDSIPAIFGVTSNAFIVFTSNVFAILGLRSLYFVLASLMGYFRLLKYGLAIGWFLYRAQDACGPLVEGLAGRLSVNVSPRVCHRHHSHVDAGLSDPGGASRILPTGRHHECAGRLPSEQGGVETFLEEISELFHGEGTANLTLNELLAPDAGAGPRIDCVAVPSLSRPGGGARTSNVFGLVIVHLAWRLLHGRPAHVPKRWGDRGVQGNVLSKVVGPAFGSWPSLNAGLGRAGLVVSGRAGPPIQCDGPMYGGILLAAPIPPLIPMSNFAPAIGILLVAASMMEQDG